jgi:hypothetical protein
MIRVLTCIILSLLIVVSAYSQDLKSLDFAPLYKTNKIKTRTCHSIQYRNNTPADTVIFGIEKFDSNGRLIYYEEFYAKGRTKARYHYAYDVKGNMTSSIVEHFSVDFRPTSIINSYDPNGKIIERKPEQILQNFWVAEKYTYNSSGVLIKTEQVYESNGKAAGSTQNSYLPHLKVPDDSITYIFDKKGLLLLYRTFDNSGNVINTKAYSYEYF